MIAESVTDRAVVQRDSKAQVLFFHQLATYNSMLVSYLDGDHKHFLLVLHSLRWFVLDFEIHLQNIFSIICSLN